MPTLDVPTLMLAGGMVCALCACALYFVWRQSHVTSAALWWALSSLTECIAISMLAVGFAKATPLVFLAGILLLIVAPSMTWAGMRAFHGRRNHVLLLVAGPAAWLAIMAAFGDATSVLAPTIANTLIAIAYLGAAIWEILRKGAERLRTRIPLASFIAIHVATLFLAIPAALTGDLHSMAPPPLKSLFGLIHLVTIIYAVASTFLLIAMKRERSELRLLRDAHTDALTGLANRRAFSEMAERIADRCKRHGESLAVIVFDLDRFKRVNDTFGHAFGDDVLRIFAQSARDSLRPGDILSRVGGEEFFAVLSGADLKDGCATAERVRRAFAGAANVVDGRNVGATVSAGVMASPDAQMPLATLVEKADAALYRAKLRGRNCVECAEEIAEEKYPRLVQVA